MDLLPKTLEDYPNLKLINDLKKINELHNIILYGNKGYGKTHLKNILIERLKNKNNFLKVINIDINDDFKKNNESKEYILNILKLTYIKLFVIDINEIDINTQLFFKSIMKKYKNVYFLICIDNISNLIENFHSFFFIFHLNDIFFNTNKNKIIDIINKKYKITKSKMDIIKKSNNFYTIIKYYNFLDIFKEDYLKYFNDFQSISMNENKNIYEIISKNNLEDNIKYIEYLISIGYSENDIINFIIKDIKDQDIYEYFLKDDFSYINLLKLIKEISK